MSGMVSGLVEPFQTAARAAGDAEKSFRASIRPRIETLERERVFAYRRMNLVAGMAREAAARDTREDAAGAIVGHVAAEFALERGRDRHEAIIERLTPVVRAVVLATHPVPGEDDGPVDVAAALAAFEAWYESETGAPFLARADIAVPETPLIDW